MLISNKKDIELQKAFIDICKGFSVLFYNKKSLYLKHQTMEESTLSSSLYQEYYEEAKDKGLWEESKKLKYLNEKKLWTSEDEIELNKSYDTIENLRQARSKKPFKSQTDYYDKLIKKEFEKIEPLEIKRHSLVQVTCENFTQKRVLDYSILSSIYLDSKLENKYFIGEADDDMGESEMNDLRGAYYKTINQISHKTIKELALLPNFSERFGLCNGNVADFFGRPIVDLTFHQSELASYGVYFSKVFENYKIPENIERDPDAIISHVKKSNNLKNQTPKKTSSSKNQNEKVSYLGSSDEEMKQLGFDTSSPEEELLKKSGKKKLSFRDLIKLDTQKGK